MNRPPVKVYDTDRATVLAEVNAQTTSIGAARAAGRATARSERVPAWTGSYAWIASKEEAA